MLNQEDLRLSGASLTVLGGTLNPEDKRRLALRRADELRREIGDYLQAREEIPCGLDLAGETFARQQVIMKKLDGTTAQWDDWHWQMRKRVTDPDTLRNIMGFSEQETAQILLVSKRFRWAVSPYYLSLIQPGVTGDPVKRQAIPDIREVQDLRGEDDPMGEEFTSPESCITRRYPDRLIINVTNQCAMYCRHCQRRRNIGEVDRPKSLRQLEAALDYIRRNPEIRDVLITGGDALLLAQQRLEWLLEELDRIPHVEIKRIGSRVPVTLPQRITDELCAMLAKHPPIYLNTQFNHPQEVTPAAAAACDRLSRAGVILGNQAVLLQGINNNPHVMKKLNQELLKIRVRPYYIFHAKQVRGTRHFIPRVEEGIEIMEKLRGFTSGLAVPTYIINAPGGLGKTPMLPEYLISMGQGKIRLRTWENKILEYPND